MQEQVGDGPDDGVGELAHDSRMRNTGLMNLGRRILPRGRYLFPPRTGPPYPTDEKWSGKLEEWASLSVTGRHS